MMLTSVRKPSEAKPARLAQLSTLPVFFGLGGKRVAVAGGTEATAWKAELVAAAGAQVDVYADEFCDEFVTLAQAQNRITLHHRPWDGAILKGAVLAICDAAGDGEAKAFYCAAKAAGVPANVIDRPAHCMFQFGSIVNRSPLVVGISTTGAAPILGQAVRRRIETLLPPTLAAWAGLAAQLRARVSAERLPGRPRRAFWERFVDAAFSGRPAEAHNELALFAGTAPQTAGKVTLVGAGPGDASLLTLGAMRALQACDVILFDDLVSDDVLELARREAKRICVGKRGARQSCRQDDITALMLKLARDGRTIVRLKCGDPSLFGRSGEEITALQEAGVEVDVIPGVTSASAMAARLKTSLTHRDHAQTVSFFTGHSRAGTLPDTLDVAAALGDGRTAIVYMGAGTVSDWVGRAIDSGVCPQTPAVAMASITRPDERTWSGPLADLPAHVQTLRPSPVLIGVGAVFGQTTRQRLSHNPPDDLVAI